MTREEKSKVIKRLTAELAENTNVYMTDVSGLNANETSNLRRACFKANIKLAVVKNTLLSKAMEKSDKDFGDLPSILKGNTSIMIAEVSNAPAKVIKEFRKKSRAKIESLLANAGTLFLVSHSTRQIEKLCTRGLWLESGKLLADGPIADVIAQYGDDD